MSDIITKGRIIRLESIDSTNTYLKELSKNGEAQCCDCVVADTQTGGRGRLGRSFSSVQGKGVYLSYLIDPKDASPKSLSEITAWGAVAVRDAISEVCGIRPQIKWVNDLVYNSRKICGILTEMTFGTEVGKIQSVVMGIGINVNHDTQDFPEEIRDIASSVKIMTGRQTDIEKLITVLVQKLDKLCDDFPTEKQHYLSEYRKSCAVTGKRIRIIKGDTQRTGTAVDISEDFGLVIDFDDGKRETVTDGEVSVRGFYGYI